MEGYKATTNIHLVVPSQPNSDWTLSTRTIIPIIGQTDVFPGTGDQFSHGETPQGFSLVPKTIDGSNWGIGPIVLWRTGTDKLLNAGKWAAGPTAVALQQAGPSTARLLANYAWSVGGDGTR